jgi:small-conductance mechanosensitive channel
MNETKCPCPSCAHGFSNNIHTNGDLSAMAALVKRKIDEQDLWKNIPKLAASFQFRPAINIYWAELIYLCNLINKIEEEIG